MIFLFLSSECEDRLEELGDLYEEATGQLWNSAVFIEQLIMACDPELLLACILGDDDA